MVAKKDFNAPKHQELENVPNLMVIKSMQSLKSRGYVTEQFAWRHYYWALTNEGIDYLREHLHLPAEVKPNTLRRQVRLSPLAWCPAAPLPSLPSFSSFFVLLGDGSDEVLVLVCMQHTSIYSAWLTAGSCSYDVVGAPRGPAAHRSSPGPWRRRSQRARQLPPWPSWRCRWLWR